MRRGLIALLGGCAPRIDAVDPSAGSALGGERACLVGRGLDPDAPVFFGEGVATGVEEDDEGRLCVSTPEGIAGPVAVRVGGPRPAVLEDGYTYEALQIAFAEAAGHYLPEPEEALLTGLLADLDGDGLDEVVVLDAAGAVTPWRNWGTGMFTAGEPLPIGGSVAGIAALPWGEGVALFACHGDAEAPRLFVAEEGDLVELDDPTPVEAAPCAGARAADLDGDGAPEAVELRADGTLRAWSPAATGLTRFGSPEPEDALECGTVTASEGVAATCDVLDGIAVLLAEGEGTVEWTFALPSVAREDAGFQLRREGGPLGLLVTDALGQVFAWELGGTADLAEVTTPPVALWTPATKGAVPTPPLASLVLAVEAPADRLDLEQIVLRLAGGGRAAVAAFETWPAEAEVAATDLAALDADDDGVPEVVAGTEAGPVLLVERDGAFVPAPPGALPAVERAAGAVAVVDADADGRDELAVACDGQDLFYRGDGTGRFFEDGAATLPVDASAGADIAAADLDRDGFPELLIANAGAVHRLYHGDGTRFEDWSAHLSLETGTGVAMLPADLDGDGDVDVLVLQGAGEPARLFMSLGAEGG